MKKFSLKKSLALYKEALKVIPAGVGSNARLWKTSCPLYVPCALFMREGRGAHVWDVDGNEYIDYKLGYGPVILGHSYKPVEDAVQKVERHGLVFAADTEKIITVANTMKKFMPSLEMVRFANSGTEATMAAIRVARAATKKDGIIKFEGHYHGWHDSVAFSVKPHIAACGGPAVPASRGIPRNMLQNVAVAEWNDPECIEALVKAAHQRIAAIITEPVMGNAAAILPQPGYLKHLRELCDRYGILLIFDEVKTGFRVGPGGAQGLYRVKPDLTTVAKALGNGHPIAAFGGVRDYMELIGPGKVMHGGTYSANPVSLTAAEAVLKELKKEKIWNHLQRYGKKMMKGIDTILTDHRLPHVVHGLPTMFGVLFTKKEQIRCYRELHACDATAFARLHYGLLKNGVLLDEDKDEAIYNSFSHSWRDLDRTLAAFDRAAKDVKIGSSPSLGTLAGKKISGALKP